MSYQDEQQDTAIKTLWDSTVSWKVFALEITILITIFGWMIGQQFEIKKEFTAADLYNREEILENFTALSERINRIEGTNSDIKAQLAAIQTDINWIRIKLSNVK